MTNKLVKDSTEANYSAIFKCKRFYTNFNFRGAF